MTHGQVVDTLIILSGLGTALTVHWLLRGSLLNVLKELSRLEDVSVFYARALLLGLILACGGAALGGFSRDEESFMDHVWDYAAGLSEIFSAGLTFMCIFAALVTILVITLGRRRGR